MRALFIALILVAIGVGLYFYFKPDAPAPAYSAPAAVIAEPKEVTVHFHRVHDGDPALEGPQPTVRVDISNYPVNDPNVVTPFVIRMIGAGSDISFSWNLTVLYKPELYSNFDAICAEENWVATIFGKVMVVKNVNINSADSCSVEFTWY